MQSNRDKLNSRGKGELLKQKYILQVLTDEGNNMVDAHKKSISSHVSSSGKLGAGIHMNVQQSGAGGKLTIKHLARQRFLDMKTRVNSDGQKVRKRRFPIHNKIVFGFSNVLIRRVAFGFTEEVKQQLQKIENEH